MSIHNWLADEKPREKLLAKGVNSLADSELLAILLRTGKQNINAVELGRDLLKKFGGINNLLTIPQKELCAYPGIGTAKYCQLQAALELARRYLQHEISNIDILTDSTATKQYLRAKLQHHTQEVFACLFLNNRNHVICYEELFFGTINTSTIYPREIIKKTLTHNATAIIFAHNHPSGIAEPSQDDINITKQLQQALKLIDVRVVDHIIVAVNAITSFVEIGVLP